MTDFNQLIAFGKAALGQEDRLLKLTTILGPDVFFPHRVIGEEKLGRGYGFTVDVVSLQGKIELKKLIARPVTLWIRQADRSYLPRSGYINSVRRLGSDGHLIFCQLSFAPWLDFLKYRRDARIWQNKSCEEILLDVFGRHPQARGQFRFTLSRPAVVRSYCTQYESDWHFVHRLMEEEGWFAYYDQVADGTGQTLVITDSTNTLRPLSQHVIEFHGAGSDDECHKIVHWSAERQLGSCRLARNSHDYKSPSFPKESLTSVFPEHGNLPAQLEVYEYTGAYTYSELEHGEWQSRIRVEEWESRMKRFHGISGVRFLTPGKWFTLQGHPAHRLDSEDDRRFAVIGVEWCIENNLPWTNDAVDFPGSLLAKALEFQRAIGRAGEHEAGARPRGRGQGGHCFNRFEVQRLRIPFRSPFEHERPTLLPQTAVVVGPAGQEVYTDQLNRIKVRMRWDRHHPGDHGASCWVRVSHGSAGSGWGAIDVPRIGQEVVVTFLGGDPDRPVVTGRLYNTQQSPQWHSNGNLSGCKSKELEGPGFNQLVFDDTTGQGRVQLYSTSSHAQLNLGYLVGQNGNQRKQFYGAGFALSTSDFGAIVTYKGLYLSTFGRADAQASQLDASAATDQLKGSVGLSEKLSKAALDAGAEALGGQKAFEKFVDATEDSYSGSGQAGANRFKAPVMLAASPAGIGLVTNEGIHVNAGDAVTLATGKDTDFAIGRSLLASVGEKISMYAARAGIKLFAGKGKVEIQAQGDDLDLIAEKVLRLLSTTSRIEIHAKEEVVISAGGSSIKINSGGITNSTSATWTGHAAEHTMLGPAKSNYLMPNVPKGVLEKTDLEFRHLTDWGEPLAGAAYTATLCDGSTRTGTLDALGIARILGVPAGSMAKVEYGYEPLQVVSTVSSEIDSDLGELMNRTLVRGKDQGAL